MARYGAEYLLDIWDSNSFCYLDVYRIIGYSAAKHEAAARLKTQIDEQIFSEGE